MSTTWKPQSLPGGKIVPDEDFPQRLRGMRIRKGLTQRTLAKKAKLAKTGYRTIQDWERGYSTPRIGGPVSAVATVLGVELAWLLWGEKEE